MKWRAGPQVGKPKFQSRYPLEPTWFENPFVPALWDFLFLYRLSSYSLRFPFKVLSVLMIQHIAFYTRDHSNCLFVSQPLTSLSALSYPAIERLLHGYDALLIKRLEALKIRTLNDHGYRRSFPCFMGQACYFYEEDLACSDVVLGAKKP